MAWDDDPDEEGGLHGPPLPPDDRLWRHPSELGAAAGATVVEPAPGRVAAWRWAPVLAAALLGGVLTAGVLAATGALPSRVVEQQVIEKVSLTPLVSSPLVAGSADAEDLTQSVGGAVVRIHVPGRGPDGTTSSGVIFRNDGMILASASKLRGASVVRVVLNDGTALEGEVLGSDPSTDVAVVQIDRDGLQVAVLAPGETAPGSTAVAVGAPAGHDSLFTSLGAVTSTGRRVAAGDGTWMYGMIELDLTLVDGCAGGAVVDESGAVFGLLSGQAVDSAGDLVFATPVSVARRVAEQILTDGRPARTWLGVAGADVTSSDEWDVAAGLGALVQDVAPGSPAELAGLQAGDVITTLGGSPIESMSALVVTLRSHDPGATVVVRYWRGGARYETTATLVERPQ